MKFIEIVNALINTYKDIEADSNKLKHISDKRLIEDSKNSNVKRKAAIALEMSKRENFKKK